MRRAWALARRPAARRIASATTLTAVAATLTILAVNADGTPVSEVDLNDGGVWVTNTAGPSAPMIARLNRQIQELDLGVVAPGGTFDVFQTETTVLVDVSPFDPLRGEDPDLDLRQLVPIDVTTGTTRDPVELTPTTMAAYGGRVVAVTDTKGGDTWVRPVESLTGFSQQSAEPDLELGLGGRVAIQPDGTVLALDPDEATVTTARVGADGVVAPEPPAELDGELSGASDLTAVGGHPFVLDTTADVLRTGPDSSVDVADLGEGLALQQPTSEGDELYVATQTGLLRTSAGGDELESVDVGALDGRPAEPVVNAGCRYAAWADPGAAAYVRTCGDETVALPIPDVSADAVLVFRTNRDVTVLNDTVTGTSWIEEDGTLEKVDNWAEVDPRLQDTTERREQVDTTERTEENHPPDARDDDLGARAGQASVLPVTTNDRDPDGDVLTVSSVTLAGGAAPVQPPQVVGSGTQVQVEYPAEAAGQTSQLQYTVVDGRQGESTANVTVRVASAEANSAPVPIDDDVKLSATVTRGASVSAYVLPAYVDPEGDDLVLDDARIADDLGRVEFRSDGTLTFRDSGSGTGVKEVELTLSDGRLTREAVLPVTVVNGKEPPALVADHVVVTAGQDTVVEPLRNDASPDGTALALASVGKEPGIAVQRRPDGQSFTLTATGVQTYYLPYRAYNDSGTSESFIRVDVLSDPTENRAPTAVKDQAVLTGGGSVLVDVLGNDFDPDGDVLVVSEVRAPEGVKASLIDRKMLRIEAGRDVSDVERISYVVSDGRASSTGAVSVIGREGATRNRAPQAADDRLRIRAGAVGSIPVLANDADPDGDALSLLQGDLVLPDPSMLVFVSGRQLRMRAPAEPGDVEFSYGVRDPDGRRSAASVRVKVLPDTAEENLPPDPEPIVERVISEQETRVQLKTAGSDPDGDAVSLKGVAVAPRLGRIVQSGLDWFAYESFPDSFGTDAFQVTVADKYGAEALLDVRIGVAPRAQVNQPPVAFDDELLVRPGRAVEYAVLTNDVDADGDPLTVLPELTAAPGVEAGVESGLVTVPAPQAGEDGVARSSVGYSIGDGLGGTDSAFLTVTADADAPLYAPVTRDDAADLTEIAGKQPGEEVSVDVLGNDGDVDGARSDLVLETLDPSVSRVAEGQLRVRLAAEDQVLAYRVSDADDMFSYGFVYVAGTDTVPPVLNPAGGLPVEVVSGQPVTIPLAQYVLVRAGREPRLTTAGEVEARKSDSTRLVQDSRTLRFVSEEGYAGTASVTAEVTDGEGAEGLYLDDPRRLTSRLTIPIQVLPAGNLPPTMRSGEITVSADGEESASLDLANFADDPNVDDLEALSFAVTGGGEAVEASVDGSVLQVRGRGEGAAPGAPARLTVTATDPAGERGEGTVTVTVLPTTRPEVSVGAIDLDTEQGQPVTVDVADFATNPFPGDPLSVSGAAVESSDGPAPAVSVDGTRITVRPPAEASGTAVVRFDVNDKLADPARSVVGRIRVSVTGRPDAPSRPAVTDVSSGTATLSWNEPVDNGAPITSYEVRGSRGFQRTCQLTSCTLDGLDNGRAYSFTVVAVNEVGRSEPSPPSAEVTPDEVPGTVPGLSVTPTQKDGELQLTWGDPPNEGSAITGFELQARGGGGSQRLGAGKSSFLWAGLSNSTQYSFVIRAVNDEGPGEFSGASDPVNPYGPPKPSAAPAGKTQNDGQLGGSVSVSWPAADDNGNPVTGYELDVIKNGSKAQTVPLPGSATSHTLNAENGAAYSFRVRAQNAAGFGEYTATSTPVTPYGKATAPRAGRFAEEDQRAQIFWQPPADLRGTKLERYEVSGPNGTQSTQSEAIVYDFGANAGPYAVTVTPITRSPDGSTLVTGDALRIEGIRPFGKPARPVIQTTSRGVEWYFDWDSHSSANGRPITRTVVYVDGRPVADVPGPMRGDDIYVNNDGTRHVVTVEVTAEQGGTASSEVFWAAPVPTVRVSAGARVNNCGDGPNCRRVVIEASGFLPDRSYRQNYNFDCSTADDPQGCSGDYFGYIIDVTPDRYGNYSNSDPVFGWPGGTVIYRLGQTQAPNYRWPQS